MKDALRHAITETFDKARREIRVMDYQAAYRSLERAHILAQQMSWAHAKSHWMMLQVGFLARDWREVIGQVPRVFAALLFSRVWVPVGNTGRARVSAFSAMPLPPDLEKLLREGAD